MALSPTTPHGFLIPCGVSEKKTNGLIPRKRTEEGRMEGR